MAQIKMIGLGLIGLLVSCGQNPFGSGQQGGLELFTKVAQGMEKPASINEEENGKDGTNAIVKEAVASVNQLAKKGGNPDPWVIEQGLIQSGDTLVYFEVVKDKPSEEDDEKLMTGRGEVRFGYGGALPNNLEEVDTTKISDLYSFHFLGRENKTWKTHMGQSQIDSVDVTVQFSSTSVIDIKPGMTWFWAKNISAVNELGKGDTASFVLDRLEDADYTQYGSGRFYDAHSGRESKDGSKEFNFDLQIIHKNITGGNPYLRYQDNEGVVSFHLPWGESGVDSLYFNIHFYPQYQREGEIHKNGPDGPVLVRFSHNEKTGVGEFTIYNESGEEIDHSVTDG